MNPLKRIKAWFIAEVPPEYAACEFHCRHLACEHGRWTECPNRLERAELEKSARAAADEAPARDEKAG
jgi:hypothetical protein